MKNVCDPRFSLLIMLFMFLSHGTCTISLILQIVSHLMRWVVSASGLVHVLLKVRSEAFLWCMHCLDVLPDLINWDGFYCFSG